MAAYPYAYSAWDPDLLTIPPTNSARLTSVVNDLMPPSSVCAPFKKNPPYQCTNRAALGVVTVLGNALAITSTCITLLVIVTSFVASYLHGSPSMIPISSVGIEASSNPESKTEIAIVANQGK